MFIFQRNFEIQLLDIKNRKRVKISNFTTRILIINSSRIICIFREFLAVVKPLLLFKNDVYLRESFTMDYYGPQLSCLKEFNVELSSKIV